MTTHITPHLAIYFGNATASILPDEHRNAIDGTELLRRSHFTPMQQALDAQQLVFLHQVHGTEGMMVDATTAATFKPFSQDGDYLITNTTAALGVLTADCLPVVIYDPQHHAAAMIHAGWRGSVNRVTVKALEQMQQEFKTDADQVQIFYGPAAQQCCYEVTPEFLTYLEPFVYAEQLIARRDGRLYFDTALCNSLQLQEVGVPVSAINTAYTACTMCVPGFCSSRRQKEKGEAQMRQMTVVRLT